MCGIASFDAQWVNIAGIVANIVGVSIVAFEWRTSIYDGLDKAEFDQQLLSLSSGGDFVTGIEIGPRAQRFAELADHSVLAADQTAFATFTANLAIIDSLDRLSRRRTIFSLGFAIILAGAALQLVAAWPC